MYCRFHETAGQDSQAAESVQATAKVDLVAERRRLKAMKASEHINSTACHIGSSI